MFKPAMQMCLPKASELSAIGTNAPQLMSSRIPRAKLTQSEFKPRVHGDCVPVKGPKVLHFLWRFEAGVFCSI